MKSYVGAKKPKAPAKTSSKAKVKAAAKTAKAKRK